MYDDAWFATVSPVQSRPTAPRHNRRVSLLKQPNVSQCFDTLGRDDLLMRRVGGRPC